MSPPSEPGVPIGRHHPALDGMTGLGVRIAVVDSGAAPEHPHLAPAERDGRILEGLSVAADGTLGRDARDRLGHGTAVLAAIAEKAPGAELLPIRVFFDRLATRATALIAAIDAAGAAGARLVNLSLGTTNAEHQADLAACLERARDHGVLVVSPSRHRDRPWLPGQLEACIGVELDAGLCRHAMVWYAGHAVTRCLASPLPRPIAGVPPERNLRGISFAAANATGLLALALENRPAATIASLDRLLVGAAEPG